MVHVCRYSVNQCGHGSQNLIECFSSQYHICQEEEICFNKLLYIMTEASIYKTYLT